MHEDDTMSRFERAGATTRGVEPLDEYVLLEPVDDETETSTGLIIPPSAESACASAIVVAVGEDVQGVTAGEKVLYPRGSGFEIRVSGQPKRLVQRRELIARVLD